MVTGIRRCAIVPRMLDHISLRVQDFDRAVSFYKAALAPIGYEVIMEFPGFVGMGEKGKPDLWITKSDKPSNPTHVALRCDRARVDAFHAAGLAAGGTDDGPPGVRTLYHPNYYGAFVLDPEGNSVEAVCHDGPGAGSKAAAAIEAIKAAGNKAVAAIKSAAGGKKRAAAAKQKAPAATKAGKEPAAKKAPPPPPPAKKKAAAAKKKPAAAKKKPAPAAKKKR